MQSIQQIQEQIIDEFDFFQDWSEKYQYLIDLGKNLPEFNDINKVVTEKAQSDEHLRTCVTSTKKNENLYLLCPNL